MVQIAWKVQMAWKAQVAGMVVGNNQAFMLISDLHSSNVIGCGVEINQSEQGADGADGMEGADGKDSVEGTDGMRWHRWHGWHRWCRWCRWLWWKNQGFMLISDIHSSDVIGCGVEISKSD